MHLGKPFITSEPQPFFFFFGKMNVVKLRWYETYMNKICKT